MAAQLPVVSSESCGVGTFEPETTTCSISVLCKRISSLVKSKSVFRSLSKYFIERLISRFGSTRRLFEALEINSRNFIIRINLNINDIRSGGGLLISYALEQ